MLVDDRKSQILLALKENHRIHAGEMSARFGVSEDTIRRDLRSLAERGLIRRVYGGALPVIPASTYSARVANAKGIHTGLVKAGISMLREGQLVFLDSGTHIAALAAAIPNDLPLQVITHSLPVATALLDKPKVKVIVQGGMLLREAASIVGPEVVRGYHLCRADLCFLGVASIDITAGIGVFEFEDAEVKRAMAGAATQVVAMASAKKFGTTSPFVVGPINLLDRLIATADSNATHIEAIRHAGIEVVVV